MFQRTIATSICARGVGVHSGRQVNLCLNPAPDDTGIVFRRTDLDPVVEFPARVNVVGDTSLSTCLIVNGQRVSTVEHLLSAAAGMGIDNLYVDVDADEIPIMDGSAAPFIFLFQSAGTKAQSSPKQFLKILKPVEVRTEDKIARIEPFNGFKVSFKIDFDHPAFTEDNQTSVVEFSTTSFMREISRARTFGFSSEIDYLRSQNLAKGGSLKNAVVLDEERIINDDGLRYEDEFVKHKMLDAIGDLYLLGHSLIGAFYGEKSGHALNNALLKALLEQPDTYEIVCFESEADVPISFVSLQDPSLLGQ